MTGKSALDDVKEEIRKAAAMINLEEEKVEILLHPQKTVIVDFPVKMDDGSKKIFRGYRVQHNTARGPAKGGIRYHPMVSLDEVTALSTWMSIKCAVLNLPYGGGKGGVCVNPKTLSETEVENLSRAYIRAIHEEVGSDKDIPAPDVYTNSRIMAWMLDEYEKITGKKDPGMITGKPLDKGGSLGRETATAKGAFIVLSELVKKKGLDPERLKVAIQGFGNAGHYMAKFLHDAGYRIVAITDSKGGVYLESGLDPDHVYEHKAQRGMIDHMYFKGTLKNEEHIGKPITNDQIFTLPVDIIIPAAIENVITHHNMDKIKAKIIVEVANGPVTHEADEHLFKNGVIVLPDILANAGGVTVSYFEWYQNKHHERWTEEQVENKLKKMMTESFDAIYDYSRKHNISFRDAAYVLAIERISEKL